MNKVTTNAQQRGIDRIRRMRQVALDFESEDDTSLAYFFVDVIHYVKHEAENADAVIAEAILHSTAESDPHDDLAQSATVYAVDTALPESILDVIKTTVVNHYVYTHELQTTDEAIRVLKQDNLDDYVVMNDAYEYCDPQQVAKYIEDDIATWTKAIAKAIGLNKGDAQ
jgi:hypothetical protein